MSSRRQARPWAGRYSGWKKYRSARRWRRWRPGKWTRSAASPERTIPICFPLSIFRAPTFMSVTRCMLARMICAFQSRSGLVTQAQAGNPGHFKAVNFTGHLPAYGAAFALPKGEGKLVSTINQTIDYMNINGIIDDVLDKYDPQKAWFIRPAKPYAE